MIIDTLRPNAVASGGTGWTAVPSGTLNGTTSDDSDSTYALSPANSNGLFLGLPTHTPAADHQRHQARHRVRLASADANSTTLQIDLDRIGGPDAPNSTWIKSTTSPETFTSAYSSDPVLSLAQGTALALQVGFYRAAGSAARVIEVYADIDTRAKPTFTPNVLDGSGTSQVGGTISDTNVVRFRFDGPNYDGLNARTWRLAVYTEAETLLGGFAPFDPNFDTVHTDQGNGPPIESVTALTNGDYVAYYQIVSTIRSDDPFESDIESAAFTVDAVLPNPPTNLTATPTANPPSIELCWEAPGGTVPWADVTEVYAQIERTDCNGTQIIALIPDGLSGCYVDRFMGLAQQGLFCGEEDHVCDVCYRVRLWGYVNETIDPITDPIPSGVIFAWPDTAASIPANFSRTTALDGRYPKGIATAATNPGTTGGSASHSHTTSNHNHSLGHTHTAGNTGAATTSDQVLDLNQAGGGIAATHVHAIPDANAASIFSGNAAPGASATSHEVSRKEVIFVQSNGTPTVVPPGMMALHHASVPASGWEIEDSNGAGAATWPPFMKGAAAAGNGSLALTEVNPAHTHPIASHSHTGPSHGHTGDNTDSEFTPGTTWSNNGSGPSFSSNHSHTTSFSSAAAASLSSASGGTSGSDGALPAFRNTSFVRSLVGTQFEGLIGMWLGTLASIPVGWLLCDGTDGTPDLINRYARHKGPGSVNTVGGGTHNHSTPNHGHSSSGSHLHAIGIGLDASPANLIGIGSDTNMARQGHDHSGGNSGSTTPTPGGGGSGVTSFDQLEPLHTQVAYIMLAAADVTPTDVPILVVTEWEEVCIAGVPNPTVGNSWIHGAASGDLSVCDAQAYATARPFGVFQPIAGGIPTVVTGDPGGRNYSLSFIVESETELVTLEAILAQQLVFFQPGSGAAEVWLAPNQTSVEVFKIGRVRRLSVDTIRVNPQPIANPQIVIPVP